VILVFGDWPPDAYVFPNEADPTQPRWDSGARQAKIAGHANTRITEEYTIVQLRRQEELTRRIQQEKRAKAARRSLKVKVAKKEAAA
jgi:hypothetical protein